jgi:hypothetical protein
MSPKEIFLNISPYPLSYPYVRSYLFMQLYHRPISKDNDKRYIFNFAFELGVWRSIKNLNLFAQWEKVNVTTCCAGLTRKTMFRGFSLRKTCGFFTYALAPFLTNITPYIECILFTLNGTNWQIRLWPVRC